MKRLLNTLYITQEGAWVCHEGESVVVRVEQEIKLRLPIHGLGGIVCIGHVNCSASLFALCAENKIGISYISDYGRFQARVTGPSSGNVLLRRAHYRMIDDNSLRVGVARNMVIGKISNQRSVLQRCLRDHSNKIDEIVIKQSISRMAALADEAHNINDLELLRGCEGDAAKTYFEVLDHAITCQKEDFFMKGRSKRPPLDNFNSLLSFLYTLLAHDAEAALESHGLDRQVGFLHAERPGRPSLALDLMEEVRPVLADRVVLSLVNLKQVTGKGFKKSESGAVIMDDDTRREVIVAFQKRKQEEIEHPFIEEKIPIGLLLYVQAQLLARHIRGDIDGYPPFLWK